MERDVYRENVLRAIMSYGNSRIQVKKVAAAAGGTKQEFYGVIRELEKTGLVQMDRHGRIQSNIPLDAFITTIYMSANGFGFVTPRKDAEALYVPKQYTLSAMHTDIVLAAPMELKRTTSKKKEAIVLDIVSRTIDAVVGTYIPSDSGKFGFVIPDDSKMGFDIYISNKQANNSRPYDKVVVKITKYPSKSTAPEGQVTEVLGLQGDKDAEQQSAIRGHDIRDKFPPEVLREADMFERFANQGEFENRVDLREKTIVTIDGKTARDLDDAFWAVETARGYELGVCIADVSHFVKEGSAIDKEAFERGNSVYLLDQVIPMLPPILSNKLCSLNPHEDKLTVTVVAQFDRGGILLDYDIKDSVMRSAAKLNYDEVSALLTGENSEFAEQYGPDITEMMFIARDLSRKLSKKRAERGAVEFGFSETLVSLDDNGSCIGVSPYQRGEANDIIEEFMLAANQIVASEFFKKDIPFIYRIHSAPRSEKLELFKNIAKVYGLDITALDKDELTPRDLQAFIESIGDDTLGVPVKMLLLQSMKQAKYSEVKSPHFGLAADCYTHFTSPIRRYSDLLIHRMIKLCNGGFFNNNVTKDRYIKICADAAKWCSKTERIAERAEQDVERAKIFEYIRNNSTKRFSGLIKSFNKSGIFVYLYNTIEGFVKPQNYVFDEKEFSCVVDGKKLHIGSVVNLVPCGVNENSKEVMLKIVE